MSELPDGITKHCYACTHYRNDPGADLEINHIWYAEGGGCELRKIRAQPHHKCDKWEVSGDLLEICQKYPNKYVILTGSPIDGMTILGTWDDQGIANAWAEDTLSDDYWIVKIDDVSK